MADLNTIFNWFKTGAFPTANQFRETFLSFRHKDSKIPMNEVEGLGDALENFAEIASLEGHVQDEMAHSVFLAQKNAENISPEDTTAWKTKLGIEKIATVDGVEDGNVYNKEQVDMAISSLQQVLTGINEILNSPDVNLDDMQEIVAYIKDNREFIEELQALTIGLTDDTKVKLEGEYEGFPRVEYQIELNQAVCILLKNIADNVVYISEKGVADGVVPLNEHGKIDEQYLVNYDQSIVKAFLVSKYVEDEHIVNSAMINIGVVSFVMNEELDEYLEHSIYYNGVHIPKSLVTMGQMNNILINLAAMGIEPKENDYIVLKYYKV